MGYRVKPRQGSFLGILDAVVISMVSYSFIESGGKYNRRTAEKKLCNEANKFTTPENDEITTMLPLFTNRYSQKIWEMGISEHLRKLHTFNQLSA